MWTLLLSLRWCHCPHHTGVAAIVLLAPLLLLRHSHCCIDVVALIAPALLPASYGHCCCRCACVVALVALSYPALLRWHCQHHCAGVIAVIVQALFGWRLHRYFAGIVPLVVLVSTQLQCCRQHHCLVRCCHCACWRRTGPSRCMRHCPS